MSSEQHSTDFDNWCADWQSIDNGADGEVEATVESIQRSIRRYRWSALGSWLVGLMMLVGTTALAWVDREPSLIAAAVAVWGLVGVAVIFDLRFRRGTWRLASESTLGYIELAQRQLIARLRGIRFGWGLLAAEALFFLAWIPWVASGDSAARDRIFLEGFGLLALLVAVFAVGLTVLQRRAQRELSRLRGISDSVADLDLAA